MKGTLRYRLALFFAILALFNLAAWAVLFGLAAAIAGSVLSMGGLSYLLGLQHGFDADHIAAIDNVTRKLRHDGQRTIATGLFFALGHSAIVILLSLALVTAARLRIGHAIIPGGWGGDLSRIISAGFLTVLGILNLGIFAQTRGALRTHVPSSPGADCADDESEVVSSDRRWPATGALAFLYRRIDASWKMFPIGFLFGLGFDTASEIAMLGISAEAASRGTLPIWTIMVFPLMFTAGMTLVDAMDGALMMGVYDWASSDFRKKLVFNVLITGMSALLALAVAAVEWLELLGVRFQPTSQLWKSLDKVNFSTAGLIIAALMAATWLVAAAFYRSYFAVSSSAQD